MNTDTKTTAPATLNVPALTGYDPGAIVLMGRHGGAFVTRYRVAKVEFGVATLVPVVSRSFKNDDGTYSSEFVDA